MKFGVVVFPGSNCDDDMMHVIGSVMGCEVQKVWHKESHLGDLGKGDCIIIPGGFSYGDYLRSGAIASHSHIIQAVKDFAANGGYVLGICNGFQILCEMGLLPGVLLRNQHQKFVSKSIYLKTDSTQSPITRALDSGQLVRMPVAHADGRYYADPDVIESLHKNGQVLFRYSNAEGDVNEETNFNGSIDAIAGICNAERNVMGMMPHPERAAESLLGEDDGRLLFESLIQTVSAEI